MTLFLSWHPQVQEHGIRLFRLQYAEAALHVESRQNAVPFQPQHPPEDVEHGRGVVNDRNGVVGRWQGASSALIIGLTAVRPAYPAGLV